MNLPSARACRTMQRSISVFMRLPKRYTRRQYTGVQYARANNCGKLGRALRKLRFRCRVREMMKKDGK